MKYYFFLKKKKRYLYWEFLISSIPIASYPSEHSQQIQDGQQLKSESQETWDQLLSLLGLFTQFYFLDITLSSHGSKTRTI